MSRIASPNELQQALEGIVDYAASHQPSRARIAHQLRRLASRTAGNQGNQDRVAGSEKAWLRFRTLRDVKLRWALEVANVVGEQLTTTWRDLDAQASTWGQRRVVLNLTHPDGWSGDVWFAIDEQRVHITLEAPKKESTNFKLEEDDAMLSIAFDVQEWLLDHVPVP